MRLLSCLLLLPVVATHAAETVTVFAAASLSDAVTDLATAYEASSGVRIVTSFAATSVLARQIENGAPAGIFMSADLKWMDYLAAKRLVAVETRVELLGNALVVVAPAGKGFPFRVEAGFPGESAFSGRIAIGDPASVPVGMYARQAFTAVGWWGWMEPRLAPTADVRAALRLVEAGEVACGVVYATDAKASASKVEIIAPIPADLHAPVRYPAAATTGAGPAALAFLAHLTGPEARPVYERYGFTVLKR